MESVKKVKSTKVTASKTPELVQKLKDLDLKEVKVAVVKGEPKASVMPVHMDELKHNPKNTTSAWVQHVKSHSEKLGVSYGVAMRHPDVKSSYNKVEKVSRPKKSVKVVG